MGTRMESQRKRIMDWLNAGNSITPIEALNKFGAFRLSAVIYVLKNDYGMPIETEMVYEEGGRRYAKYSLSKECVSDDDLHRGDIVYVKWANVDASNGLFKEMLCLFLWWDDFCDERSFVTKCSLDLNAGIMEKHASDYPRVFLNERTLCFRKANEEELKIWEKTKGESKCWTK